MSLCLSAVNFMSVSEVPFPPHPPRPSRQRGQDGWIMLELRISLCSCLLGPGQSSLVKTLVKGFLLKVGLVKKNIIWCISKLLLFPYLCGEIEGIFPPNIHCDNQVELLDTKVIQVWGFPVTRSCRIGNA